MTFTIKQLQASITINPASSTPTFAGGSSNTITFGGPGENAVRIKAEIHNAGGLNEMLDMEVYGLPLSVMNQLSTFGVQINLLPKNAITLLAGDDSGLSQIFSGSIIACIARIRQPEAVMKITANTAAAFVASPLAPASYNGSTDVATAMQAVATAMGLKFENNGVSIKLSNSYFYGSPFSQYKKIVDHSGVSATISNGTLAIWPRNQNRTGQVITISPGDGSLIDYPEYTATGIMLRALFNPSFSIGRQVAVSGSVITGANATWNLYGLNHMLESQTPDGKWETILLGSSPKFPTPVI